MEDTSLMIDIEDMEEHIQHLPTPAILLPQIIL
jgi:hypothetical protein